MVNLRALYAVEYAICYIIKKFTSFHNHPLPFNEVTTKHFRRKSIMHPKVTALCSQNPMNRFCPRPSPSTNLA